MPQSTPEPIDPSNSQPDSTANDPGKMPPTLPPAPVKKRRRRLWPKLVLSLLLILVLVIVLLPTIISTNSARQFILGKINQNLNGKLEIAAWSIGWTNGIDVRGIRILDDQQRTLVEIAGFKTRLSLLKAIGGTFDCGDTTVDDPDLVQFIRHADGTTNFDHLIKKSEKSTSEEKSASSSKSAKLPRVSINLHVVHPRGTVVDEALDQRFVLDRSSDAVVKITSLDKPIENAIELIYGLGDSTKGTIALHGTVSINDGPTNEAVQIIGLDVESLNPFIGSGNNGMRLAGMMNGQFAASMVKTGAGNPVAIIGGATISNAAYTPAGQSNPAFMEKELVLADDLAYDPVKKAVTISNVALDAKQSDLLHLAIKGGISDLTRQRNFENLQITLGYDLEKLWPVVKATLTAEQQEDLKELVVKGKQTRLFTVAGSFPADVDPKLAMKNLIANASFAVDHLEIYGMVFDKIEIPVSLRDGIARTIYGDKPHDQQLPAAMDCNKGKVDIGGIAVDLTGPYPLLTIPKDKQLIGKVTLNPLLSDKVGKYVNPTLANAKRAQGLLDVKSNYCENVALGADALKSANSGKAQIDYTVTDLDVVNPFGSLMLGQVASAIPIVGQSILESINGNQAEADTFDGSIIDSLVTIDQGKATVKTTLELVDNSGQPTTNPSNSTQDSGAQAGSSKTSSNVVARKMPLKLDGVVNLADQQMNMNASLPVGLLTKIISRGGGKSMAGVVNALQSAFPDGIPVTLRGTTKSPKIGVDVNMIAKRFTEGQATSLLRRNGAKSVISNVLGGKNAKADSPVGNIINGLTGDGKDGTGPGTAPSDKTQDLLGGLLNQALNKKKPAPQDAAPATADPAQPDEPATDSAQPDQSASTPRRGRSGRAHTPTTAPASQPTPTQDP